MASVPLVFCQQPTPAKWGIKTNLTGFLHNAYTLEVERSLGGNVSLAVRGGILFDAFDKEKRSRMEGTKMEGYFFKIGTKIYLSKEEVPSQSGFAIKPEILFTHWRDWDHPVRFNYGFRWERSFGGMVNISYSKRIIGPLVIEPFAGVGYVPTWEKVQFISDVEPFSVIQTDWTRVNPGPERYSYFSHFNLGTNIAVSGGVLIGVTF